MLFFGITLCIAVASVILAVRSLKQLQSKKELEDVKKELTKGRVVYQADSSSSS